MRTCGQIGQRRPRLPHHLAADIHAINLAEDLRQRPRHAPGPAADFEHPHALGILALADVGHVGQDLFGDGPLAGLEELLVGPIPALGVHVVAGVLAGPLVPFPLHLLQFSAEILLRHYAIL